jgi:hypothetical protein
MVPATAPEWVAGTRRKALSGMVHRCFGIRRRTDSGAFSGAVGDASASARIVRLITKSVHVDTYGTLETGGLVCQGRNDQLKNIHGTT